jgi:hypothetical protein
MNVEDWWNDADRGKQKYFEKKLYATLSTTDSTWTGLELNLASTV